MTLDSWNVLMYAQKHSKFDKKLRNTTPLVYISETNSLLTDIEVVSTSNVGVYPYAPMFVFPPMDRIERRDGERRRYHLSEISRIMHTGTNSGDAVFNQESLESGTCINKYIHDFLEKLNALPICPTFLHPQGRNPREY